MKMAAIIFHLPASLLQILSTRQLGQLVCGKNSTTILRLMLFSGQSGWPSVKFW